MLLTDPVQAVTVPMFSNVLVDPTIAEAFPVFSSLLTEAGLLQELLYNKVPKLHKHLQATGCEMSIIATDWFLCLFATTLPSEVRVFLDVCLLAVDCVNDERPSCA